MVIHVSSLMTLLLKLCHLNQVCVAEDLYADSAALIKLFSISSSGCILLLEDVDLHFSMNFSQHYDPSKIISTTSLSESCIYDASLSSVNDKFRVSFQLKSSGTFLIHWRFSPLNPRGILYLGVPRFDGEETAERQKRFVQNFFKLLTARILAKRMVDVHVILIMNNIRFSHLQVENLARDCFFFLTKSFQFDESTFGAVPDFINTKRPLVVSSPIAYVFNLHIPWDLLVEDYVPVSVSSSQNTAISK